MQKTKIKDGSNNYYGFAILTYGSTGTINSTSVGYTLSQWADMEAQGAVFLGYPGSRYGNNTTSIAYVGSMGNYWLSTCYMNNGYSYIVNLPWSGAMGNAEAVPRSRGCCVRLVCE